MRVIGVDCGTKSIKAVELDAAFGRYEIRDYHDVPIPTGSDPAEAMRQLMASLQRVPDRIAVAMSSGDVTFRNLDIPTRGKKAIQAAVGFELEDELPFAMDVSVYDYTLLSQGKTGSRVHVAATLQKHVESTLARFLAGNVDPDLLTTESWAYRTLMSRILNQKPQDNPVLVVHLGHAKSTLYLHWQGAPVIARELAWGGRDLTTAICKGYNIPLEQAEQAKLEHGFVIPPAQRQEATEEQVQFSDTLAAPLGTLIKSLQQIVLTCKNLTRLPVGGIYLSGGSSLLPGLGRLIEENLEVPVQPLRALSSISPSGVTYSEHTDATFTLAGALALSLVGQDRAASINFRKAAFAKQARQREFDFTLIKRIGLASGAVLACLLVSLVTQSSAYRSRLKEVDTQLERNVKSFFTGLSPTRVKEYIADPQALRGNINKELTKQRELANLLSQNPHSPLEVLKSLSAAIPKDVVVDVTRFQAGAAPTKPYSATEDTDGSVTFLIANPQVAERVAAALGARFGSLQRGKPEEVTAADGTKKWKVTFSGKLPEEIYANQ